MAKLILTEEEQVVKTWAELDNETLGKVVKSMIFGIKKTSEEQNKMLSYAAALILCDIAMETNADKITETIEGLTLSNKLFGNWKITVRKLKK